MNYEDLRIELIDEVVRARFSILLKTSLKSREKYQHYRNLLSIVMGLENPSIHRTAYLTEKYIRTIPEVRRYYELREANYLGMHSILRKALFDEVQLLSIQGAESILSRVLFLLASVNHLIHTTFDLSKYLLQLNNILTIPVPPRADEAKSFDLLGPGEDVGLFIGDVHSTWVVEVFTHMLVNKGHVVKLYICSEEYETNVSSSNVKRVLQILDKREAIVKLIDCRQLNIESMEEQQVIIANNLVIYKVLDDIDRISRNALLVFNPSNTVLQKVFGQTPIIISVHSLKNNMSEVKH